MHRIDVNDVAGEFTEGDLDVGTPPTKITANWLNDVQENLVDLITGAGISLVKGSYTQARSAVNALIATAITAHKAAANTWSLLQTFSDGLIASAPATANRSGVVGTGNGTGRGGSFTGGSTSGTGVDGRGGGPNGLGVYAEGAGTGNALRVHTGNAWFSASNPASNVGFTNVLTPLNVPKAWALIICTPTTPTVQAGFNIDSVSYSGGNVALTLKNGVTFSGGIAQAAPVVMTNSSQKTCNGAFTSGTLLAIQMWSTPSSANVDLSLGLAQHLYVVVFGEQ
jgi:hypothetical protein